MENEYLKEIERLKAELDKYRWIPVSERLPEAESVYILTFWKDGEIALWRSSRLGAGHEPYVSHWMPLPDPASNKTPASDE